MSIDVAIKYATEVNALNASARSVTKIADELERVARNERALTSNKLKAFRSELGSVGGSVGMVAKNTTGASNAMGFLGGMAPGSFGLLTMGAAGAGIAIGSLVSKVFDVSAALVRMGAEAAVAFGQFAVKSAMFREDTLTSLGVLLKSKDVAKSVYDSAVNFASVTPFSTEEVVTGYRQLLAVGFKVGELKSVFTSLGDFAAGSGIQGALPRAVMVFGQIRAAGRLLSQDMNQLSSLGLDRTKVYEAIGKTMGKSAEEARKLAQDGKVDAETALKAIMSVMNTNFGGMMSEKSKDLSGLWSTLISKPFELMNKAAEVKGGGVNAFYDSVKGGVKSVIDLLYEGENLTAFGESTVGGINAIGKVLKEALGVGRAFFDGFIDGLSKNNKGLSAFRNEAGELDLKKLGESARKFGGDAATIADALARVSAEMLKLSESDTFAMTASVGFTLLAAAAWGIATPVLIATSAYHAMASAIEAAVAAMRKWKDAAGGGGFGDMGRGAGGSWGMSTAPAIPDLDMFRENAISSALGGDNRALPIVRSAPGDVAGPNSGAGGGGTVNNNSVSVSVSGGMMPAEIAALVRREVDRALEAL